MLHSITAPQVASMLEAGHQLPARRWHAKGYAISIASSNARLNSIVGPVWSRNGTGKGRVEDPQRGQAKWRGSQPKEKRPSNR